jgi:DMSO reductase family type II enzyme chaperone
VAETAAVRCQCYAAWSLLTASPHDVELAPALQEQLRPSYPLAYAGSLPALLAEFAAADLEQLRQDYSALFEVGSAGPPVPIREDLFTGQRAGTREDLVRFYDYFSYRLGDRFAWAPDHLSVELEFMHFLCYHEARESADRLSWQLAQLDFATRHLQGWVPQLAAATLQQAPDSSYGRVLTALAEFTAADIDWQAGTIEAAG